MTVWFAIYTPAAWTTPLVERLPKMYVVSGPPIGVGATVYQERAQAMTNDFDQFVGRQSKLAKWKASITWSALIIIGLLIYELTTQPILGVIVVCSKFGWNDFLLAFLLRRVDPNQPRGRTVSWFCLAFGLLKVVYASVFLAIALSLMLGAPFGPAGFQGILLRCISAWGVALFGYLLITAVVFTGAFYSKQSQLKVWLTSPFPLWHARTRVKGQGRKLENLVDLLIMAALFPLFLGCFSLLPVVGELIEPQPQGNIVFIIVFLVVLWVGILTYLLVKVFLVLKKRFAAPNPFECWDLDVIGKVMIAEIPTARRVRLLLHANQLSQT
jgi:hypothetical protein